MKVEEAEVEKQTSTKPGKKAGSKWWKVSSVVGAWKNFKAAVRAARIKHFENLISAGLPGEVNLIMFDEIEEPERQRPRYKGVRQLDKTGRWVSEIRPTVGLYTNHKKKKIWLGSFGTPEEAARAFDVSSPPQSPFRFSFLHLCCHLPFPLQLRLTISSITYSHSILGGSVDDFVNTTVTSFLSLVVLFAFSETQETYLQDSIVVKWQAPVAPHTIKGLSRAFTHCQIKARPLHLFCHFPFSLQLRFTVVSLTHWH